MVKVMNHDQIKIKYWSGISKVIPLSVYVFCMVYITKYVNMSIEVNLLYVASMLTSLLSIFFLYVSIKDKSLSLIDGNLRIVNTIDYLLEGLVNLLLLIDPFLYVISSAFYKGTIGKISQTGWRNMWNKIYSEELKTQFENFRGTLEHVAAIVGGIAGWVIGKDIDITAVIYIAVIGNIIHGLTSQYTLTLAIKYRKKMKDLI